MQGCQVGQDYVKNRSKYGYNTVLFLASEFLPRGNSEVRIYINEDCNYNEYNKNNITKFVNELKVEYNLNKREEVRNCLLDNSSPPEHSLKRPYLIFPSPKLRKENNQIHAVKNQSALSRPCKSAFSPQSGIFPNDNNQGNFNLSQQTSSNQKSQPEFKSPCQVLGTKVEKDYLRNRNNDRETSVLNPPNSSVEYSEMMNKPVTMNTMVYLHLLNKQQESANDEKGIEPPKKHKTKRKAIAKKVKRLRSSQSIENECNNKSCTSKVPCRKCQRNRSIIQEHKPELK